MAKINFMAVVGGLGRIEGRSSGQIYVLMRELLADQGSRYLVGLGVTAIAMTLVAPNGLWGLIADRFPIALFGIGRRLVLSSVDAVAPPTTNTSAREGQ